MNIPFQYTVISRKFVDDLCQMLHGGESAVLIGPRYGGKRHVMLRIQRHLSQTKVYPVVRARFLGESLISTEARAMRLIRTAVLDAYPGVKLDQESGDFLGAIERLCGHS